VIITKTETDRHFIILEFSFEFLHCK